MASKIKSIKKAKKQISDLVTKINEFSVSLLNAKNTLNDMMKGNGTDAYWQGQSAVDWYTSAVTSINKMMNNYNNSYRELEDYAIILERALTKADLKGLTKAVRKKYLSTCTGEQYLKSVKYKNLDKEKFSGNLPATVSSDVANDDQNRASYTAYLKLKNSFQSLEGISDNLIALWRDVQSNTSGKMNTDASKRVTTMNNRKKEITTAKNSLEENYVGDMLFS